MSQLAWCQKEEVKKKTWIIGMVITFFFRMFELVTDAVFSFVHRNTQKITLPPINNPLLLDSASSLAHKIRTRQVYTREGVFCHLSMQSYIPKIVIKFFIFLGYQ